MHDLAATAKQAEGMGFSSIALNDHFNSAAAPMLGLQAMAAATSQIRIATSVLNQDLRHPAVLDRGKESSHISSQRRSMRIGAPAVRVAGCGGAARTASACSAAEVLRAPRWGADGRAGWCERGSGEAGGRGAIGGAASAVGACAGRGDSSAAARSAF
ncbi:LLM class flavin-dependent oxidoreductase [Mycobacterium talmoniae]|uniref:LLM class flavin-dependent oxidoreductase n=1 Tax=Mycobacterium talmoniae TaxID=1858794 RepID=UPI003BF7EEB8